MFLFLSNERPINIFPTFVKQTITLKTTLSIRVTIFLDVSLLRLKQPLIVWIMLGKERVRLLL